MSEGVTITRLSKAAREFNIGMKTVVDFLTKKGFPIEMDPNAKLTQDMYNFLMKEFASEKHVKEEAKKIMLHLAEKHLIAGGLITNGDSAYWWNNELVEKVYYNISTFTTDEHKQKIIQEVRAIHSDEVPIITFTKHLLIPELLGLLME